MRAAAVVSAATLILAAPAFADDTPPPDAATGTSLFATFQGLCLATGGRPDAVQASAKAAGFKTAPTPATMLIQGTTVEKAIGGVRTLVISGTQDLPAKAGFPAATSSSCEVAVYGRDEAGLNAAKQWVGVPAAQVMGTLSSYVYRQHGEQRTPIAMGNTAAIIAAAQADEATTVFIAFWGDATGDTSQLVITHTRTTASR
jgi:hypothetical protein